MQTSTLFITLMNREFKNEKLGLTKIEKRRFNLSYSILNSMLIRLMKRVFVFTNHKVIIANRVHGILYYE